MTGTNADPLQPGPETRKRRLYLLRHAKSGWDDPSVADFDRPLDARGERAIAAMAVHCRQIRLAPSLVLCSPSRRTRMTWRALSQAISEPPRLLFPEELYGASAKDLADCIARNARGSAEILVIGHNPGMHDFALSLAGAGDDSDQFARLQRKFSTAALATFNISAPSWDDLLAAGGDLTGFVTPKQLV